MDRMPRFQLIGLAAVATALLVASPAAARSHCPRDRMVVHSANAVVFTRGAAPYKRYYGCLLRVKKVFRLNQTGEFGLNVVHRTTIRLAGRYVAYEQDWGSGAGSALNTVSVRDLST